MTPSANDFIVSGNDKKNVGNIEASIEDYTAAIRINPNYAEAYYNRGNSYSDLNNYEAAVIDYSECIRLKPGFHQAYNMRGSARMRTGDYTGALNDYNHVININNYWGAYNNRAALFGILLDYDNAIKDLERTIVLNPDYTDAYNNLGLAYQQKGNYLKSFEYFSKALYANPDNITIRNNYEDATIIKNELSGKDDCISNIEKYVLDYLSAISNGINKLSLHQEGELYKLPSWVLGKKNIKIGWSENRRIIVVKIAPDPDLSADSVTIIPISNLSDFGQVTEPHKISNIENIPRHYQDEFLDAVLTSADDSFIPPIVLNDSLIFVGGDIGFLSYFNEYRAKQNAIGMWSSCEQLDNSLPKSYVLHVNNVLSTFESVIDGEFVERRVHRFLYKHHDLLLPPHSVCHYEHDLILNDDKRTADFILQREHGVSALLVELESTKHKVFTKTYDLRAEVNHAKTQIADWIRFIDDDPTTNASDEFSFLRGPKDRLVIIGRGLDDKDRLIETKRQDTLIWTYDMLLENAKNSLNERYLNNCKILNLPVCRPF